MGVGEKKMLLLRVGWMDVVGWAGRGVSSRKRQGRGVQIPPAAIHPRAAAVCPVRPRSGMESFPLPFTVRSIHVPIIPETSLLHIPGLLRDEFCGICEELKGVKNRTSVAGRFPSLPSLFLNASTLIPWPRNRRRCLDRLLRLSDSRGKMR